MLHIVLYQPDIPQNTGTILRNCACFDLTCHLIEPLGFVFSDKKFKRSLMDYERNVRIIRHEGWQAFQSSLGPESRIILATTKAEKSHLDMSYCENDYLLFGSESRGVPADVHDACPLKIKIPMLPEARSINLACSVSIIAAEAMRQLKVFDRFM